jgi:murein DD-endopeptidase MepM/ murein hydrolase activator NlpD
MELNYIQHYASFGALRKYDIHTGIDLYCKEGEVIKAFCDGEVVKIAPFTGRLAGSDWWEDTFYVGILTTHGYVVFGEVEPYPSLKEGDFVTKGAIIGTAKRVLKKDKGLPTTMLHLELYDKVMEPVTLLRGEKQPDGLCDPSVLLQFLRF